jgi:hypothetical protein
MNQSKGSDRNSGAVSVYSIIYFMYGRERLECQLVAGDKG